MAGKGAGQAQRRLPRRDCQLLAPVSLRQFLSHVVLPSFSQTLVQPPFNLHENIHFSHEYSD